MAVAEKNIASCQVELIHRNDGLNRALRDTLRKFREACQMMADIAEKHWSEVVAYPSQQGQQRFIETLIHSTKLNTAMYPEFDQEFYKFPSYYRRAAINFVLGQLSSYHTRLMEYNEKRHTAISNGKKFQEKPPVLNMDTNVFPSMYKDQMYSMDGSTVKIKVFIRNTWDWVEVAVPNRDRKDLAEKSSCGRLLSPSLQYKFHKYYLSFPIEYPFRKFPKVDLCDQKIMGVDLGIKHGAAASIMDASGTVLGRYFDPFKRERDRIEHLINRIRKAQSQAGTGNSLAKLYTKLDGVKQDYARKLARWITNLAIENNVYGVVLENLSSIRGNHSARIHHWCKCKIRDLVKGMCFREGIRVFIINPRNTSALAFDGSGKVTRGDYKAAHGETKNNYSVCTFPNGKQYNCDLNASYNIGARYFIRAFFQSMPETEWSQLTAEVPELAKRTNCTLSTLWKVALRQNSRKNAG